MQHVSFRRMDKGTPADYALLNKLEDEFTASLPNRILTALNRLEHKVASYQVSRLENSLQSAKRAERDGADIEMIVGALIHHFGNDLAPMNHSQVATGIIRPYVRCRVAWVIENHGVFQMNHYADAIGADKNAREIDRDHQWFESCEKFCEQWDQMSFDPDYNSISFTLFKPMVREIFSRPPFDPRIVGDKP